MPRGPVIYNPPPGTVPQAPNTVISSSMFNNYVDDVTQTLNTPVPEEYGGTGGVHGGPTKTANGSIGVGVTPAGILDNGKGIALGDNDTGIRQNGDGVVEVVVNGVVALTSNSAVAGGTVSLRGTRAFQSYTGGNFDAGVVGDVLTSVDFTAVGNSIMATGTCQINQTGGTQTVVFSRIRIRDLTNSLLAHEGVETRVRTVPFTADEQGPVCHAGYSNLTIGRAYRIEFFVRKQDNVGPVFIQDRTISAIHV